MNRITFAVRSALGLAMLAPPMLGWAQDAPATASEPPLQEVVVTGIRHSVEESLQVKKDANTIQEVISAEDIGKMPDKNIADSLTRVVGVTTSSASANEGGFDENDRVSMRGTNPSLTQTLINGHGVAAGDWFVLDQVQQVGRSVSYTLLPSELISQVVVHKSSQASLVEGGVAGSIDIITRKPLDFSKPFTFQASAAAVYADLPNKTDGQYSALFNWKGDNMGLLVQGFYEARHLRRDGIELLGYEQFAPGSAAVTAHPDLANVYYPALIGEALFTQHRTRKGGLVDFEIKPTDSLTLDFNGFMSKLDAGNYNRNYLEWLTHFVAQGAGQAPDPGYLVQNGTLTRATFTGVPGTDYGIYDQISRPDESATAAFVDFDANWKLNDALSFSTQLGTSKGDGKTPTQDVSETAPGIGTGAAYVLNNLTTGASFNLGSENPKVPGPLGPQGQPGVAFGWIFGAENVDVKDKETWAKIDGDFAVKSGAWSDLSFGVRYQTHERSSDNAIAQGPTGAGTQISSYPQTWTNYPDDFTTFGATIPSQVWFWTPGQLAAYNSPTNVNRDLLAREYYQYLFDVRERNWAAYIQANFAGDNWSADVGLRAVRTEEHVVTFTQVSALTPGAITTSAFGPFIGIPVDNDYNDLLPSANFKYKFTTDLIGRAAVSETMTRADYSALAGFTDLSPPGTPTGTGTGSGGNPDLKPIRSTNVDLGLEWYFDRRSLLSAGLFYMDLQNYVSFGSTTATYLTYSSQFPNGAEVPYLLSVPVNAKGRVQGFEAAYQQALGQYFGVQGNYTFADGKQTSLVTNGDDRLVGTSKNSYSVSGYFENAHFSARVSYVYRSAFFSGLDRNTAFSQDAIGSLAASLVFTASDNISVSLDGQNLNNPTLKYYALDRTQPRAFYKNGAQYYVTLRAKF